MDCRTRRLESYATIQNGAILSSFLDSRLTIPTADKILISPVVVAKHHYRESHSISGSVVYTRLGCPSQSLLTSTPPWAVFDL